MNNPRYTTTVRYKEEVKKGVKKLAKKNKYDNGKDMTINDVFTKSILAVEKYNITLE